jgi:hypothetical protein
MAKLHLLQGSGGADSAGGGDSDEYDHAVPAKRRVVMDVCVYGCACPGDGDCENNGAFGPDYPEIPPLEGNEGDGAEAR